MRHTSILTLVLLALLAPALIERASAQSTPAPAVGIRGYATAGTMIFTASDTFDAVLGKRALPTFGGGVEVILRGNLFIGVGAWRAREDGERVFVGPDNDVFPLGIPLTMTVTPLEVTGGWRFTSLSRRFVPYAGAGLSSFKYAERSDTDDDGESLDDRFNGFHVLGGVEARLGSWIGVAGEVVWTSVPDGLGAGGASRAFDETNLGGTAVRVKVVVGR